MSAFSRLHSLNAVQYKGACHRTTACTATCRERRAPEAGRSAHLRRALLKQLVPAVSRVAILWNPTAAPIAELTADLQGSAHSLGVRLQFVEVRQPAGYDAAFAAMVKDRAGAVVIQSSPIFLRDGRRIVDLAAKHQLPAAYLFREDVMAGGLLAYGPNISDMARLAAVYVDKILKGAKPAELPVQQPTKFELLLNLKTAKALSLSITPALWMRADELID